jgi:hypothetical protein
VAIGHEAGNSEQRANAVAVGHDAGKITQGDNCVAIGAAAGATSQQSGAIAIGSGAGATTQSSNAIAIGAAAGATTQQSGAIAIGDSAGGLMQGSNSICIGNQATSNAGKSSSIVINATGVPLDAASGGSSVTIAPITVGVAPEMLYYNNSTGELTRSNTKFFVIDHPIREDYKLIHSCIEGPQIDLIYRGKIKLEDGYGEINIDEKNGMTNGTFEALRRDIHSFTTNETGWEPVRSKVMGNILHIQCKDKESEDTISWMVIGERKDKGIMQDPKTDEEGKLITEQPNSIAGNWRSSC